MNREHISALMDGELDDAKFVAACAAMKDDSACECWATYHLIGDALRQECFVQPGFAQRLSAALAAEPTVLAPTARRVAHDSRSLAHWTDAVRTRPWYYGLAAAASFAAVGLVGWFGAQEFSLGPALTEQASLMPRSGVATIAVNSRAEALFEASSQGLLERR